jgi:hypothetical protein
MRSNLNGGNMAPPSAAQQPHFYIHYKENGAEYLSNTQLFLHAGACPHFQPELHTHTGFASLEGLRLPTIVS